MNGIDELTDDEVQALIARCRRRIETVEREIQVRRNRLHRCRAKLQAIQHHLRQTRGPES
mgnify:CR=1 FL=1